MPLPQILPFIIWVGLSTLWIMVTSIFVLSAWTTSTREIHEIYERRANQCTARYTDPLARERCLTIMDLERFQSRSIVMFNRGMLILGPPLIGFSMVAYLHLRKRSTPKRKRSHGS